MKKIEILSDSTLVENSLKETRLINYEKIKKVFSRILRELNDVERQKLTNMLFDDLSEDAKKKFLTFLELNCNLKVVRYPK
ncbi:MAG: hypothetical protein A2V66_10610 [Ignavibacteria bacterium RBG_13_36_8]|nr:MAG: hypothetical protein A2V66_10610 [Ignavibacteria bacterium RBG_13_36_8]